MVGGGDSLWSNPLHDNLHGLGGLLRRFQCPRNKSFLSFKCMCILCCSAKKEGDLATLLVTNYFRVFVARIFNEFVYYLRL